MAQEQRRNRQNEDGGRQALVPSDAASMATMIGAMLIGLSAADATYREPAVRSLPAPEPPPDPAPDPKTDAHAPAEPRDGAAFRPAEDAAGSHAGAAPAMDVLPPAPGWDPWTRFDPLDTRVIDVVDQGPAPPPDDAASASSAASVTSSGAAASTASAAPAAEVTAGATAAAAGDIAGAGDVVASSATAAQDMIGETMAVLDAAVTRIASSVGEITQPLTAAVETTVEQIGDAVEDLGAAIGGTVDAVGGAIEGVTRLAAELPEAVLGGPEAPAIPDPVFTEAFKPDMIDAPAVDDVVGTVSDVVFSVTETLHLGFLGQATMDGMDPHDGAFSIFGSHV